MIFFQFLYSVHYFPSQTIYEEKFAFSIIKSLDNSIFFPDHDWTCQSLTAFSISNEIKQQSCKLECSFYLLNIIDWNHFVFRWDWISTTRFAPAGRCKRTACGYQRNFCCEQIHMRQLPDYKPNSDEFQLCEFTLNHCPRSMFGNELISPRHWESTNIVSEYLWRSLDFL